LPDDRGIETQSTQTHAHSLVLRGIPNMNTATSVADRPFQTVPAAFPTLLALVTGCLLIVGGNFSAQANVYATDIRLQGATPGTTNSATVCVPCDSSVLINYRLNEAADAGVTVEIHSEATVVRAFTNAPGNPGAQRGMNSLIWDLRNEQGQFVPFGSYTVHITAAGNGHGEWTQISDDFNAGNYVLRPRGIAVNRNTNSPYYGRVFVSNAEVGLNPESEPGDRLGILKLNADGSRAEGGASNGGWFQAGSNSIPSKIEVSDDDYVFVNDSARGLVLRFDQAVSAASRAFFLRSDNWPNVSTTNRNGPFITGAGANTQVWMADGNDAGSVGIRRWTVGSGGTIATNDLGITVVAAGTNSSLSVAPFDVALDRSNRIYTIQSRNNPGDPVDRAMRFPADDGSGQVETNADWSVGGGNDNMRGASGIAVDSTATYVAVAFLGSGAGLGRTGGAVKILSAATGLEVQTLTPSPFHDHTDVAWDNVGNLYVCDNADSVWRVFSPPGANQATTVARQTLEVAPPLSPQLQAVGYTNGQFLFTLFGRTNVDYIIVASTNVAAGLSTWTPVLTNRDRSFIRLIAVTAPENRSFYRAFAP
jgi:hypothetical protein